MNLESRFEGPGRGTVVAGMDEPLVYEVGLLTAVGCTRVSEVLWKPFTRGSVERIVIVRGCRVGWRRGMRAMIASS
jgi:hypothetical protein